MASKSGPPTRPPVELSVDAREFVALAGKASQLEPRIRRRLRKELKAAADTAAEAVRDEVRKPPATVADRPRHTGLRDSIARGVKVQLNASESARRVGVNIRASASSMPANKRVLMRRWNRKSGWRHPVFAGDALSLAKSNEQFVKALDGGKVSRGWARRRTAAVRDGLTWVQQTGRPYFGSVIVKHKDEVARGVRRALDHAVEETFK